MAICKSCAAPIRWELTAGGKRIPLDAAPVDGGNLVFNTERPPRVIVVSPTDNMKAYVSHFVTCPNAAEHRSK